MIYIKELRLLNLNKGEGFKVKEFWNTIQIIFAAVGGWLGYFLGGCDGLVYALFDARCINGIFLTFI